MKKYELHIKILIVAVLFLATVSGIYGYFYYNERNISTSILFGMFGVFQAFDLYKFIKSRNLEKQKNGNKSTRE